MNQQPEYRNELKYLVHVWDYYTLRSRLKTVLSVDRHAGAGGDYHIRSLYYDGVYKDCVRDKLDGVLERKKFRVRIYNHDRSFIRLECKKKNNQNILKTQMQLSEGQCQQMMAGDYDFLADTDDMTARDFLWHVRSRLYRPAVIVDYEREAYVFLSLNVRITFDKGLRSGPWDHDLFNKDLMTREALQRGLMIMEVKFDQVLPGFIRNILHAKTVSRLALSKFNLCNTFNRKYYWEDQ